MELPETTVGVDRTDRSNGEARNWLKSMEFKVSELEREPIEFDLALPPGRVDLGDEAKQEGDPRSKD